MAIAEAMQVLLDRACEVEIWNQGTFELSQGTLEALVTALDRFDFALFALTADDVTLARGKRAGRPRDNVLFELGLFVGGLGRDRTFMLHDRGRPPELPTDLAGITSATFEQHESGNLVAALGAASTEIRAAIQKLGVRPSRQALRTPPNGSSETVGPAELLLRQQRGGDLRLVLTSVPVPAAPTRDALKREFNYLAGLNEVLFAWSLRDVFLRLVPSGYRVLPLAYSKQMFVESPGAVSTVNRDLWEANLVISGSTKFNDATRDVHDLNSGIPATVRFEPTGGVLVDHNTAKRYRTDRRPSGEIRADYGVLARYWNLYDRSRTIILIAGVESVFQLGITRALETDSHAQQLLDEIRHKLGGKLPPYYEALIKIPGLGREATGRPEVLAAYRIVPR